MTLPLLRFYEGTGTDDRGRRLEDVWHFSDEQLEHVHDYIQWLFPLTERSAFNPGAPLVDEATIQKFRTDATLRSNLARSYERMREFYRDMQWVTPGNHNYLRLTRILKSLTLLGLGHRAADLFAWLEGVYAKHEDTIGPRTLAFWRAAAAAAQGADPSSLRSSG
ncbi:MAG TPA: opioid growth factor receptor-related protein [Gemmatimonadaceae bacterium]|nr:opioid growth factor receptor-related protein [Gemmatimonadaceae bacterium]